MNAQEEVKQPKKRFISVKLKWSIGTGIGVLTIFTLFSCLLFNSFTSLLLKQEKQYANNALVAAGKRLSQGTTELNKNSVSKALDYRNRETKQIPSEQHPLYQDSLFSSLSQQNIGVSVYSISGDLIYASRNVPIKYSKNNSETDHLQEVDGNTVFVINQPVKSQVTHNVIGYVQVTNKLVNYDNTKRKLLLIFIIFGITAGLTSILLGYVLSNWLLGPIDDISKTIDKINTTKDGDSFADIRVPAIQTHDELSQLAELFNDMLDRMERYIDQQQQFVEDVSHELRTPVAIIQGHLELLNRWGKDDPQVLEESITASLQEITRMRSLVQEMLDLSRAEQVEIHFGKEITDVCEVTMQVYNNLNMIHPDFLFVLDNEIRDVTPVQIYRNHLEQVLIILLDNAVKYSTDRKEIHVSMGKTERFVEIAIQDFGEGISQENIEKVFNRFYRVDKARSRDKGGNGLGLSIAQRLIEGYKGHLTVESVEGRGSVFRISLPVAELEDE
ncbi:HAMP domain-containing sensor histidine kinase [Ligilactobacillus ceti]|uniref:Signal transduction histidine-protein kinase ArlS n=1 Tax=Ligilactobacillus ceti DSM 22408 TaxID=1122146 RepID=A0A0R2KPT4_9LACO|nr:HAMP domain-containing histidine kinase [Ligilactobacillus ceti]KRN88908.1 ATPase histidine kinase DNA gyrase B HSP90 domain protein [Ligilactobacillus ceti DSM 22408]